MLSKNDTAAPILRGAADTHGASEFDLIRRRGYAECVEEIERGMCSVAAPLGASWQTPTMSIGATGSVRIFKPAFRKKMGRELIDMAADLSDRLGWGDAQLATG